MFPLVKVYYLLPELVKNGEMFFFNLTEANLILMPSTIQCLEIIFESFVYTGTSSKMLKDHPRDAKYDDSVQASQVKRLLSTVQSKIYNK